MLARIAAPPTWIAVNKSQVVTTAQSRTYCIDGSRGPSVAVRTVQVVPNLATTHQGIRWRPRHYRRIPWLLLDVEATTRKENLGFDINRQQGAVVTEESRNTMAAAFRECAV